MAHAIGLKRAAWSLLAALACTSAHGSNGEPPRASEPSPAWQQARHDPVRGVTLGPIESALHVSKGYGTEHSQRALGTISRLGGNWVSLTPFGRIWDLTPSGVDRTFEQPFESNKRAVARAIAQAHALGLKVMLVPHLWVETGGWRGELAFEDAAAWASWARAYREFVLGWAKVARDNDVELFSLGVELRSWVTTRWASSFSELARDVRQVYKGPLTYAANWDDASQTVIWGELDVIGVNAFFPLTDQPGASDEQLLAGARKLVPALGELALHWNKPVLFTEIGYTNRPDPALRPWEWPEALDGVSLSPADQARAYRALLAAFIEQPWFMGFFVWRMYSDPFDTTQEPGWGFSPLHKQAELVLRDAFQTPWEKRPYRAVGTRHRIGDY